MTSYSVTWPRSSHWPPSTTTSFFARIVSLEGLFLVLSVLHTAEVAWVVRYSSPRATAATRLVAVLVLLDPRCTSDAVDYLIERISPSIVLSEGRGACRSHTLGKLSHSL